MKQLLQSLGNGQMTFADVPIPAVSGSSLLVETRASVVSAGTERMLVAFGRSSLIDKARSQPERVRDVVNKIRTDGIGPTFDAVRAKLDDPIALGYCHAGIVRDAGPRVASFSIGDRVVTNGPHAEFVRVPRTLAARIPDGVSFEHAAFTPLAAIGLQGLRLAQPTIGETVVIYGLGLIGLLTLQLVRAAGCRAIGIDPVAERRALARAFGAEVLGDGDAADLPAAVRALTADAGADAVLLTLTSDSDEPLHYAAEMSRKRGRIVLVGVTGLNLRREDFFKKELSFQVSCSYGPGRYDPDHEQGGLDYPVSFVRWTEGRNFSAVLQLMADGKLDPGPLITHRFPFAEAASAYDIITSDRPGLGIVLQYAERVADDNLAGRVIERRTTASASTRPGVLGCFGAGNFASRILVPAFADAGVILRTIVAPGGTAAAVVGNAHGFERMASEVEAVLSDPAIDIVAIATRHDSHARLVADALRAGKHVFVEKPLALSTTELEMIADAHRASGRSLCVGFNRRFAPLTIEAQRWLTGRSGPLALVMTINAGALPPDHWTKDPVNGGGRIVGEACHFIDLARCLAASPIEDVQVTAATRSDGNRIDDVSAIQLRFADGSWAAIQYVANGHRGFPKERVELFWDERTLRIDNFRRIEGWGVPTRRRWIDGRQDKGHKALVREFVQGVRDATSPPIALEELFEVSRWAITAAALASGRPRA